MEIADAAVRITVKNEQLGILHSIILCLRNGVKMEKDKIINHFGMDFYNKIVRDLDNYKNLWGLSDFRQIDYYSVNCIFRCTSNKYGLCILKIGKNAEQTENESRILHEYNGKPFCKIYEADTANGVLLIECISPGTQLRAEPDLDKRLSIFYEVSCGMHIEPADKAIYPTYMGWVSRITEYMRCRKDYKELFEKMAKAEQICRRLWEKYPNRMLLHGDLHHDNILLGSNDHYYVIDPKGVIGDCVFDIPRFILNEFDEECGENFTDNYVHITRTLSKKFKLSEYDIRCLTYVEMCMANCWSVEDGEEPDMKSVLFTEKMMNDNSSCLSELLR